VMIMTAGMPQRPLVLVFRGCRSHVSFIIDKIRYR
jgi:hypothetical protein